MDREIQQIAARQHGVVARRQLTKIGLSEAAISRRARNGRWTRLYRGVYALGAHRPERLACHMAAVLAVDADAAISHASAAHLIGVWRGREPSDVHVVRTSRRRSEPGLIVHRTRYLPPSDVQRRFGMPVTTLHRTLLDLGDVTGPYRVAGVMDEAAFRNELDLDRVRAALQRGGGRRATTVLRRALELYESGSAGTRSTLEDDALDALDAAGVATPLVNVQVEDMEVDMYWPAHCLVVEVDGPGHSRPGARRRDHERDQRLQAAGLRVIRVGGSELRADTAVVVERIRQALMGCQ